MIKLRHKLVVTAFAPLLGWFNHQFEGPWWLYLIALALFLLGLMSFSVESAPDRSGYDNRADDGRGHSAGFDGSGGGDC